MACSVVSAFLLGLIVKTNAMRVDAKELTPRIDSPGFLTDPLQNDDWLPDYLIEKGLCCRWKDRHGNMHIRKFYNVKLERDALNGHIKITPKRVWSCPGKWRITKSDSDCNGMDAFNLFDYKEDTDWVLCCKNKQRSKYFYYVSSDCHRTSNWIRNSCMSYDCTERDGVDQAEISCNPGYRKIINPNAQWACPAGRLDGFTDKECAGYAESCAAIHCIMRSNFSGNDCHERCTRVSDPSEQPDLKALISPEITHSDTSSLAPEAITHQAPLHQASTTVEVGQGFSTSTTTQMGSNRQESNRQLEFVLQPASRDPSVSCRRLALKWLVLAVVALHVSFGCLRVYA